MRGALARYHPSSARSIAFVVSLQAGVRKGSSVSLTRSGTTSGLNSVNLTGCDRAGISIPNASIKGQTVAVVTDAGKVYVVAGTMTNNNARLVPHMGYKVVMVDSLGVENGTKAIYESALKMVSK